MGYVIFEVAPGPIGAADNLPQEWLVNFRVPAAGNDGGLIAVTNSQRAAEELAKVLNWASTARDRAVYGDSSLEADLYP